MTAMPTCQHPTEPTVTFRYRDGHEQSHQWTGCRPCSHLAKSCVPALPETAAQMRSRSVSLLAKARVATAAGKHERAASLTNQADVLRLGALALDVPPMMPGDRGPNGYIALA